MEETLRRSYLEAMGIQQWVSRRQDGTAEPEAVGIPGDATTSAPAGSAIASEAETPPPWLEEVPLPVDDWVPAEETEPAIVPPGRDEIAGLDWKALEHRVRQCESCELHRTRTNTVFGVGDRAAELMVIGEAPGADEDRQGEPFVGRAGQLLNAMLWAIGLKREQVFIANILKCRPPGNRDPRPEEILRCEPFLRRQLALVRPKMILAVGRVAAQSLLKSQDAVGRMRGRVYRFDDIPLVVTYHPAYLLRSPEQKEKAWQDLQRVRAALD
jgi:DNA polymerase